MALVKKAEEITKPKPFAYRCEKCGVPLVGRWVVNENVPGDPTDDTLICLSCARLIPIEMIPPAPKSHARFWLCVGIVIGLVLPWVPRIVRIFI